MHSNRNPCVHTQSQVFRILLLTGILFFAHCIRGQELTIEGNRFFMNGMEVPMWGVRVASASQSDENTGALISSLDDYFEHGVRSISVYLQGSSGGYSNPFLDGGQRIAADHLERLIRIIEACEKRSMVVLVGVFYQRTMQMEQTQKQLPDKASVFRALETTVRALKPFGNVIINIANEQNSARYRGYKPFDFNDPQNIIDLCRQVKLADPDRIAGGGGYHDSSNVLIGRSPHVDVLLFDTYSGDISEGRHSGWHYDYFRAMGVTGKPMINVEIFGGWTRQFVPPGVYTEEGKDLHLREIDEASKREGLHVHFHSNPWIQGPSDGYPTRYHLGGDGTAEEPGIRWWFDHLRSVSLQGKIISLEYGERIWSGIIVEGDRMPYPEGHVSDFFSNRGNQIQPLLLSNRGLYVWSEEPYRFEIGKGRLIVQENRGAVITGRAGNSLREARAYASEEFFPASGQLPDETLFSAPQYNTWIELTYNQNQQDVLEYARAIIDNGFPPGVLMIDDTWQEDYGVWDFHPGRFPEPGAMIEELHRLGFKVMLWVCPFVSADQALVVREIMKDRGLLLQKKNPSDTWKTATEPAVISWWNGQSALLDFTNPAAVKWFGDQLDHLVEKYGVDGFKLDAGDTRFYDSDDILSMKLVSPNEHCRLFALFGLRYPLNEYRACWKMGGQPIAQRLRDKYHIWEDLQKLIPHMITEGLSGFTFSCPDMIGGGDYVSFLDLDSYDQELVVRSAQCHALMPMMQFSVAPWRILDRVSLAAVKKAVETRLQFTPLIMDRARHSAETGEPVMSSLEYYHPGEGFEEVNDQFMLGEDLMVAPMVTPGNERTVTLPEGRWVDDTGKKYRGGRRYTLEVPIDRIPFFQKIR